MRREEKYWGEKKVRGRRVKERSEGCVRGGMELRGKEVERRGGVRRGEGKGRTKTFEVRGDGR